MMYLERNELPKAFLANCFVAFTYYQICSRYKLLTKEALESQLSFYAISSISYNALQTKWGSNQNFHQVDIVPFTLLLLAKDNVSTWKTIGVTTALLGGAQTATAKALNEPPPPPPPHPHTTRWLETVDMTDYGVKICDARDAIFSLAFEHGHVDSVIKAIDQRYRDTHEIIPLINI